MHSHVFFEWGSVVEDLCTRLKMTFEDPWLRWHSKSEACRPATWSASDFDSLDYSCSCHWINSDSFPFASHNKCALYVFSRLCSGNLLFSLLKCRLDLGLDPPQVVKTYLLHSSHLYMNQVTSKTYLAWNLVWSRGYWRWASRSQDLALFWPLISSVAANRVNSKSVANLEAQPSVVSHGLPYRLDSKKPR